MNTLALLPNLFGGDGLMILLILLLLFGAKRLPELAKGLGSAVREFSKAKDEIEHELTRPAAPAHPRIEPPRDTEVRRDADPYAVAGEPLRQNSVDPLRQAEARKEIDPQAPVVAEVHDAPHIG